MSSGITAGFHRANSMCPVACVQQYVQLCSNGLHWLICGVYNGFIQWYICTSNGEIARQSNGQFTRQSCRMAVGAGSKELLGVLFFFFFYFKIILAF